MTLSPEEYAIARDVLLLRALEEQEFQSVIAASKVITVEDGAFFFMEEDCAEKAYVLLDGKVKLTQITLDGQQVLLEYLTPGRLFGIIAVLENFTYPVTAQAVGRCRALWWDRATLNQLMEQYPRMALNALRILAGRIRLFQYQVQELSTQRVERRIARAILRLARQSGRKTAEGVLIDLPLSRQDLAEMTGTTLYTVSRVLKEWEKRGVVESKRQQVLIRSPHGLVIIAEDLPSEKVQPDVDLDTF